MKFYLVDRVLELEAGKRLVAVKNLSLAEEYLQDHFPSYPVLPGVLMIEALVQGAAWLQRLTAGFAQSMVVLDEIRNIRYGAFFRPGTTMRVDVELLKQEPAATPAPGTLWSFKGTGAVDAQVTVQGRFSLRAFNLAETSPALAETDREVVRALRQRWALIAPRTAARAGA